MGCFCKPNHQLICQLQLLELPLPVCVDMHPHSIFGSNKVPSKYVVSTTLVLKSGLFADLELFWLVLLYKTTLPADHSLREFVCWLCKIAQSRKTPVKSVYILVTCKCILEVKQFSVVMQVFLEIAYLHEKLAAGLSPSKVTNFFESFCLRDPNKPDGYMLSGTLQAICMSHVF